MIIICDLIFLFLKVPNFFYNINLSPNLKNEKNVKLKQNPKISVIIPVYNGGKYLHHSLKSVQNQRMKDIEIIIIDDNSNDDSLKIIHNYMKNDERIKLIENKVNRKILYCKSIGTLNSKGKYIIELDQDDMFINDDAFDILYNEAEKNELDILNFKYFSGNNTLRVFEKINYENATSRFLKQPKLKFSMFKAYICILWGNIIKADLYKKVIYNLWPIIINYKIIFQEDFLITFFILIYARKCKRIKNKMLFHYNNNMSASEGHLKNSEYYLSVLFAPIIYYDYHIDYYPKDIQLIINYIDFLKRHLRISKKLFPSLFNFFFGKLLSNPFLQLKYKIDLITNFNISENCDSYIHLNHTQTKILKGSNNNFFYPYKQTNSISKLSIIIIIHNNFENILNLINSINEQKFDNFEIILIFQNIDRRNLDLIKNYTKNYNYFKLLDKEMINGTLYSIIQGVIIAKGKYLMIIDDKCFFLENNAIRTIYEEIDKIEFDILEFDLYRIFYNNYMNLYKCKHLSSKFNLSQIKYNYKFNELDINKDLLFNKIIKANYFRNCIRQYKLNEINETINNYFHEIILFMLESNNNKFNYSSKGKIYKNDSDYDKFCFNDFSSEKNRTIINEIIFYINFIFDNSKNTFEAKETILQELFKELSSIFNKFSNISDSSIELFNKFMNCNYISETNKNLLKFYYLSLIN